MRYKPKPFAILLGVVFLGLLGYAIYPKIKDYQKGQKVKADYYQTIEIWSQVNDPQEFGKVFEALIEGQKSAGLHFIEVEGKEFAALSVRRELWNLLDDGNKESLASLTFYYASTKGYHPRCYIISRENETRLLAIVDEHARVILTPLDKQYTVSELESLSGK